MLILLSILTLITFILLFSGEKLANTDAGKQARTLIKQYDEQKETDPTHQEERDIRLYHELRAILHQETREKKQRLPIIAIPLFLASTLASTVLWYQQNGQDALKWYRLETVLKSDIQQSKIYGASALKDPKRLQSISNHTEQAQFFSDSAQNHNIPLLYCQALQRKLDRGDTTQLKALANCYSSIGEYTYAEPIYDRLIQQNANDSQTILEWAQSKTLAHPNEPIAENVHQALIKLNEKEPNNLMAQLFLASSYQQRNQTEKALPLWKHLATQLQPSDPLYTAVQRALDNAEKQITTQKDTQPTTTIEASIHINPKKLQQLPPSARLYLIVAPVDHPIPIAVKTLPLEAEQQAKITDQDTMQGTHLGDYKNLELRLKLSPTGIATDPNALETRVKLKNHRAEIHLD